MSARSVLTVVGAGVGFFVGGPAGAAIGAQVGGAVGGYIDGPQQFEGPRLTDLRVNTSTYGEPIPIITGPSNRMASNLIWTSGLKEKSSKKKQGGKGGPSAETTEYSYSVDVANALAEGVISNVKKIWANNKVLVDIGQLFIRQIQSAQNEIAKQEAEILRLEDEISNYTPPEGRDPAPTLDQLQAQLEAAESALADAEAYLVKAQAAYDKYLIGGESWAIDVGGMVGRIAFYPGDFVQLPDPTISAALGANNTPAYRGTAYLVMTGLQLADYGNSIPNLEYEVSGSENQTVAGVVKKISERSGLQVGEYAIGGALSSQQVQGYVIGRQSEALGALRPLEIAYGFDTTEQGGQIRYVKRGRMAISSIELGAMAARPRVDGQGAISPLTTTRQPDVSLPKLATLSYRDLDRDYQENTQRAIRDLGNAEHKINENLAMTFETSEARRVVDRILWESWVGRMTAEFAVSDKLRFINTADVVAIRVAGVMTPFRVEKFHRGNNGELRCSARMEDPFIYQGSTAGAVAVVPVNEVQFVGETFGYAYNAPIIYPNESPTSFSWAMDASESGWRGGQFFRSTDGVDYTSVGNSKFRNTTGIVTEALPLTSAEYWDRESVITVTLLHEEHELESFPEDRVIDGLNAFWLGAPDGSRGEVIQFATAVLVSGSPRVYELSDLLRGRRGTEHDMGNHIAGEVFVYFEAGLMSTLDYGSPDWDRLRYYKGVSIYESEFTTTEVQEFVNIGEKARPRSPVLATGERDEFDNLTIDWVRRIRGFAPGLGYGNVPLDEQTEQYEVDIYNGPTIVRTISTTSSLALYSAAEQTTDGLTPGNDVTIKIYQISATRGRGHAGEFTL